MVQIITNPIEGPEKTQYLQLKLTVDVHQTAKIIVTDSLISKAPHKTQIQAIKKPRIIVKKRLFWVFLKLVAGAGFEPTTFGL